MSENSKRQDKNVTGPTECRTVSWSGHCPHCAEPIRFSLKTDFGAFGTDTPDVDWLASLSKVESEILALAQSTGVFDSFSRTMLERKNCPVANMAKSFLKFLGSMKLQPLPDRAEIVLDAEFPNCKVAVYSCGDVSAIAVEGELRMFVPTAMFFKKPTAVAPAAAVVNGNGALKVKELTANMHEFRDWVKTRMGYVPRDGAIFLKEMRKRCYGAFGTHENAAAKASGGKS
jgi:hypothetical protein